MAPHNTHGFSLFEVLITVVVISIGLLGLAGLQFAGLRAANNAYQHTLAVHLTEDIIERLHANRAGVNPPNNFYNSVSLNITTPQPLTNCYGPLITCTPANLYSYDLYQWDQMIKPSSGAPLLPNLSIQIQQAGATFIITLIWGDLSDPNHPILSTTANFSL